MGAGHQYVPVNAGFDVLINEGRIYNYSSKTAQELGMGTNVAGRRYDSVTGEIQPWYTHLALDEIQKWDLHDKVVLEWGGGFSSLWWAKRCLRLFTI
jgi:hypothetical protein